MKKWVSIEDILTELSKKGKRLSRRTFLYYVQLGLLPKGRRKGQPSGGVRFFYPSSTLERLEKILELKERGLRLREIRELLLMEEEEKPSPEAEIFPEIDLLKRCTLCGICGGICPVYEEMDGSPWRVIQIYLEDPGGVDEINTPWICIGCYLCEERCPEGIPLVSFFEFLCRRESQRGKTRIYPQEEWSRLFWTLLMERGRSFDFGAVHAYQVRLRRDGGERKIHLRIPQAEGQKEIPPPSPVKNPRLFRKMLALSGGPSR
ncbi:4Fe-4S dicluster domain-containing protein [Thermosulfurimonas sp. F29]|uniref:4Fe-4S dicluster domain-containing protein n=1 Tax=Thermosulfurimonas sp. F29 TaxID=2867247 RepID=UPI001C829122|nr:4Fe-4S dicluster domain-containing protein [Thermosulfurimonas sp. F29]MBX6424028.1 4Fe-4S dicluster domain-containing protein [Thermosulfurimonas sp. F29]